MPLDEVGRAFWGLIGSGWARLVGLAHLCMVSGFCGEAWGLDTTGPRIGVAQRGGLDGSG